MIMLPTNFMPRFFKSFEMASDNGELTLSTSWMIFSSVQCHKYRSKLPHSCCTF